MAEIRHEFTDPVSGKTCHLVIPDGGRVAPQPGFPKIGVAHPGCDQLADLSLDLDAFYCPPCRYNGRISGAWACRQITKRGEQYSGWRAIAAGSGSEFATAGDAERWMYAYAADLDLIADNEAISPRGLYRRMAKAMHPDKGGPRADWDRLDAARQLLDIK